MYSSVRSGTYISILELHTDIATFFMGHNDQLSKILNDENVLCKFEFLADIFGKLKQMNLSLQG